MRPDLDEVYWYAVRIRPRTENVTTDLLRAEGLEVFFPTYRSTRQWSDRKKTVTLPLFPGYLFCRFAWGSRRPVVVTPGVLEIVSFGDNPAPVDPVEIESLRLMVASGVHLAELTYFEPDERVIIESGPLTGVEGAVVSVNKRHNLIVSISLLRRSVATEIDPTWVRRVSPRKAAPAHVHR